MVWDKLGSQPMDAGEAVVGIVIGASSCSWQWERLFLLLLLSFRASDNFIALRVDAEKTGTEGEDVLTPKRTIYQTINSVTHAGAFGAAIGNIR